jgi:hypothetical protein
MAGVLDAALAEFAAALQRGEDPRLSSTWRQLSKAQKQQLVQRLTVPPTAVVADAAAGAAAPDIMQRTTSAAMQPSHARHNTYAAPLAGAAIAQGLAATAAAAASLADSAAGGPGGVASSAGDRPVGCLPLGAETPTVSASLDSGFPAAPGRGTQAASRAGAHAILGTGALASAAAAPSPSKSAGASSPSMFTSPHANKIIVQALEQAARAAAKAQGGKSPATPAGAAAGAGGDSRKRGAATALGSIDPYEAIVVASLQEPKRKKRNVEAAAMAAAVRASKSIASSEAPLTPFGPAVRAMLHAGGDAAAPQTAAVTLVERHTLVFVRGMVRTLRRLLGRPDIRVADFVRLMPDATRVYFRWKTLKGMAAPQPAQEAAGVTPRSVHDDTEGIIAHALAREDNGENSDDSGAGIGDDGSGSHSSAAVAAGGRSPPATPYVELGDAATARGDVDEGEEQEDEDAGGGQGAVLEDDEEDTAQLQLLMAAADEELRTGKPVRAAVTSTEPPMGGAAAEGSSGAGDATTLLATTGDDDATGAASATGAALAGSAARLAEPRGLLASDPLALDVCDDTSGAMRRFHVRLAFANQRSRGMTTAAYAVYAKAREASFTGSPKLVAKFAAALPGPPLRRTVLEVLSYLAYDRVSDVTEAANRIECEGALTHVTEPLSAAAYIAAVTALPSLPAELDELVAAADRKAERAAAAGALADAREIERARLEADDPGEQAGGGSGGGLANAIAGISTRAAAAPVSAHGIGSGGVDSQFAAAITAANASRAAQHAWEGAEVGHADGTAPGAEANSARLAQQSAVAANSVLAARPPSSVAAGAGRLKSIRR